MKRFLALTCAVAALCLSAAEVVEFRNVKSGELDSGPRGGRLARVEAFAPDATGTVSLKSVWSAAVFTNIVEIETFTATNVTVVSSNRVAAANAPTNAIPQTVFTNVFPAAGFSFAAWTRAHPVETLLSSNTAVSVSAVTNTTLAFDREVAVTNTILSGASVSGHVYGGDLTNKWIAPGERLIYTGPSGGFLRLMIE